MARHKRAIKPFFSYSRIRQSVIYVRSLSSFNLRLVPLKRVSERARESEKLIHAHMTNIQSSRYPPFHTLGNSKLMQPHKTKNAKTNRSEFPYSEFPSSILFLRPLFSVTQREGNNTPAHGCIHPFPRARRLRPAGLCRTVDGRQKSFALELTEESYSHSSLCRQMHAPNRISIHARSATRTSQ